MKAYVGLSREGCKRSKDVSRDTGLEHVMKGKCAEVTLMWHSNQSLTYQKAYIPGTSEHTLILITGENEKFLGKTYFREKSYFKRFCKILAKNIMTVGENTRSVE